MNAAQSAPPGRDGRTPRAVLELLRPEIRTLQPYEHGDAARDSLRLHANELPWNDSGCLADGAAENGAALNRYPTPRPQALTQALAALYSIDAARVLVTRGSDDGIDLLVRAFCRAGEDTVMVTPPSFGMYALAARIQHARVLELPLRAEAGFSLDARRVAQVCNPDAGVKLVFLCSPNNPTGNGVISRAELSALCRRLAGTAVVVLDEAYVEFASWPSLTSELAAHPNLVVLRTLSKAYGLAGIRCGAVLGDPGLIAVLAGLAPPYALPAPCVELALSRLTPPALNAARGRIEEILHERARLARALGRLECVREVLPSEANFLLVQVDDGQLREQMCREQRVLVRRFPGAPGLQHALRITVGTAAQNARLLAALEAAR